ncbi:aminopeptidase N [Thiomicrorhabdus cannonii]|uniref:aminopeptidase N n=1 Tax=Thiomicrorhabdus cannonii TaxID=2748011 RepID=UPI0015C14E54|nr:aminopeptidase N [Thiomicrorhabdus cannonii]
MSDTVKVHYLRDYQAPLFELDKVYLEFDLQPQATRVTNTMQIRALSPGEPLVLNGEKLQLLDVRVNGESVLAQCDVTDEHLTVKTDLSEFELSIDTEIAPESNTSLEGLYRSSGNYCTQCEAEGFRKITYFLDRPDVMTLYTTKIIAPKADCKVLLSNGNLIESGELDAGRHYAVWEDPFRKPCYLFALVAGNLECIEDQYRTADGRDVTLRIYVEPRNIDKCEHAMSSLKKSMQWDEQRFGLVYDLDIYMIVAVDDFNMGAMENKGLNVFNSKFVLAKPETATDVDYEGIEAVIAHEYFHNWTGNRVTCRDWFQLTLKEGLTVFRDQEFTADMLSPAVKRIEDVKRLRNHQFPEDAGPMAHPIQPQSYIEMNNFYTMTVYEKGAEVVRLYHTLLGEAGFQQGMKLYFERHDGDAVTVEDFRNAMADANGIDLTQMHNWYVQSGTPTLQIAAEYDAANQTYRLHCRQNLPAQEEPFKPLLLPIKTALLAANGKAMPLKVQNAAAQTLSPKTQQAGAGEASQEVLLVMREAEQTFVFEGIAEEPTPSFLRGFSAPVNLQFAYSDAQLSLLSRADDDAFARWEAFQTLAMNEIKGNISRFEAQQPLELSAAMINAFAGVLLDRQADRGLVALTLPMPDLTYIGEQYRQINVEAVYAVQRWLKRELAQRFEEPLLALYEQLRAESAGDYRYEKTAIATRKLKNVALGYLLLLEQHAALAEAQFNAAQNMTDVLAALESLSHTGHEARLRCLERFYMQWRYDPLVLDKWFAIQAGSHHLHALEHVKALVEHADFHYENPNRVRSVLGVFGRLNLLGFHRADGAGYAFLAEQVIKLDKLNPQVAARMVAPFTHWKRYDAARQQYMQQALQKIMAVKGLSKDVFEIVSKSLKS